MANVTNMFGEPATAADNTELIKLLEETLERARAGSITGAAVATIRADGTIGNSWAGGDQTISMIASVSMLHHDFLHAVAR